MLDWCIVTLAGVGLKASVRFSPLGGIYQRGTFKGCDILFQKACDHSKGGRSKWIQDSCMLVQRHQYL